MEELTFSKQELMDIKKTLDIVLDDINKLYNASNLKNMYVKFTASKEKEQDWTLLVDKNIIIFQADTRNGSEDIRWAKKTYRLEWKETETIKRGPLRKEEKLTTKRSTLSSVQEQNDVLNFLSKYEDIRKKIVNKASQKSTTKDKCLTELEKIRANYSQEVLVDFGLSESQNINTLEVVEEEGRKVGTINFGNKTIKIITAGDIVLVEREKPKQKKK